MKRFFLFTFLSLTLISGTFAVTQLGLLAIKSEVRTAREHFAAPPAVAARTFPEILPESHPVLAFADGRYASAVVVYGGNPNPPANTPVDGLILTCAHCITNQVKDDTLEELPGNDGSFACRLGIGILVKSPRYSLPVDAAIVWPEDDLALLIVHFPSPMKAVPLASEEPALGEQLWSAGYPFIKGVDPVLTVSLGAKGAGRRISNASIPGNSGSAVLNVKGELVGLIQDIYFYNQIPVPFLTGAAQLSQIRARLLAEAAQATTRPSSRPTSR